MPIQGPILDRLRPGSLTGHRCDRGSLEGSKGGFATANVPAPQTLESQQVQRRQRNAVPETRRAREVAHHIRIGSQRGICRNEFLLGGLNRNSKFLNIHGALRCTRANYLPRVRGYGKQGTAVSIMQYARGMAPCLRR